MFDLKTYAQRVQASVQSSLAIVMPVTAFDGNFDARLKHFALAVGVLFDKRFDCLADSPPLPMAQYPDDFVAKVEQDHRTPVGGYFFSAYPRDRVPEIQAALLPDGP